MRWYTRDTGGVRCSPTSSFTAFGVNKLGFVNVYAKDIGCLPEWQQKLWAGFNISPEGGVSEELLAAQAKGIPAETQAPEAFLQPAIQFLNEISTEKFGFRLFREHDQFASLLKSAHRFRATDQLSVFSLAKDLAKLTAEGIDASALQKIVPPPNKERWGSLKSLEHVLALQADASNARALLSPLVGINELRHADAHLPSSDIDEAFALAQVDQRAPFVSQGKQLLHSCVSALYRIAEMLKKFPNKGQ